MQGRRDPRALTQPTASRERAELQVLLVLLGGQACGGCRVRWGPPAGRDRQASRAPRGCLAHRASEDFAAVRALSEHGELAGRKASLGVLAARDARDRSG